MAGVPRQHTAAGAAIQAAQIDQELKDDFIRLIYDGLKPDIAARKLGSSGTQFRRCYSGKSDTHFDPDFAQRVADALVSDEHNTAFLERLRGLQQELAFEDKNMRMIEKLSYIYDPAWEVLRNPNLNVNVNVLLQQAAPGLTRDQLESLRGALVEAQKRKEIESGDVIDHQAA